MEYGQVKWFNTSKGFGFITSSINDEDIFVHFRNIKIPGRTTLREGEMVQFTTKNGAKGKEAENVEEARPA